ncbi:hypothetical protein [Methanolobus bombayensis]|uniref:hypothetical protein n=1 Tax=Methanolobus bombayensis TaxID=38023 RepID=UPI001AE819B6|nr:hypothetical protein [Methanolobus bombayensis]MBP1909022.1 hypothetical protein [Methanolobus bombayensis]
MKKCIKIYSNSTSFSNNKQEANLELVINGHYRSNLNKEDIEFARFMIGGIEAK